MTTENATVTAPQKRKMIWDISNMTIGRQEMGTYLVRMKARFNVTESPCQ